MSSHVPGDSDQGPLVEPEGVNAGGPVDRGAPPAAGRDAAGGAGDEANGDGPEKDEQGQGQGGLLSRAGSDNGLTRPGPGQELSAEEG